MRPAMAQQDSLDPDPPRELGACELLTARDPLTRISPSLLDIRRLRPFEIPILITVFVLNQAELLEDLKSPPGNLLESLKGDRRAQHSIRINDQFRVCFRWTTAGPEDVEIVDYHR